MSNLEIIRVYYDMKIENSCYLRKTMRMTLFIPKSLNFFVYPLNGYRAGLEVRNKKKDRLPVLPYGQLLNIINEKSEQSPSLPFEISNNTNTLNDILNSLRELMTSIYGIPEESLENFSNFVVLRLGDDHDEHEELEFSWLESLEELRKLSKNRINYEIPLELTFSINRVTTYISIDVAEKFEIVGDLKLFALEKEVNIFETDFNAINLDDQGKIKPFKLVKHHDKIIKFTLESNNEEVKEYDYLLLQGKRNLAFRFGHDLDYNILLTVRIGVPSTVKHWSYVGAIISILVIIYLIVSGYKLHFNNEITLGAGAIGGMIAMRILLFHDLELLKRWNYVYILLIICVIGAILFPFKIG